MSEKIYRVKLNSKGMPNFSTAVEVEDIPIYGNEHNCMMTIFGECSYAETGCGDCAVVEKVRKALSADRPQEWIPCSERMPEEREWIGTKKFGTTISDEVLVTFESRGERFVKPIHFQNGELGGMDKHTMDAVHGEWKVVAWMPLPEPWKGADDE